VREFQSYGEFLVMRRGWQPADPPQRPVLFMNPKSGGGKAARADLGRQARDRGIDVIVLRPDHNFVALVGQAVDGGADALGVAGGDGSLAVVAAAAVAHGLPFVCVPAGTRNHFALDVGVDRRDLLGSLDAFTDGVERRIDVAEVSGRLFLNNVSLGIYGDAVRQPTYRDAKTRTLLETAARVLGPSAATVDLQLVDDRGRAHRNPAVVLVSNNAYTLDPARGPRTRPTLDGGELGIIVLDRPRAGQGPGRTWTATRLEVSAPAPVHAGIDGEAVELAPPFEFVIAPRALRVRIARQHLGLSPSGPLHREPGQ
jgi:diacylglycerol kinase family enzyme